MKLSLGRASTLALVIGSLPLVATSACADAEVLGDVLPSIDAGDAGNTTLPEADIDAAPTPVKDASVEAGPKTCSDHGFCPTAVPDGRTINGLWGDGNGVVWAATKEGDVLRWDGSAWKVHAAKLGALNAIWGSGSTDVWVGGEKGLYHGTGASSDALTFAPTSLPGDAAPISSIWGLSASDVWAVGTGLDMSTYDYVGRAYHFTGDADGGGAWELASIGSNKVQYSLVWGTADSGVWLGGPRPKVDTPWVKEMVVLHKMGADDFVETTLPVDPDPTLQDYEKESVLTGAVVGSKTSVTIYGQGASVFYRSSVWRGTSTDDGKTFTFSWAMDARSSGPAIHTVYGAAANDVWAAGDYGRLIHWNGTMWSTTAISVTGLPVTDPLFAIWGRGASELWIGGKGMALRFDPAHEKDGGVQ